MLAETSSTFSIPRLLSAVAFWLFLPGYAAAGGVDRQPAEVGIWYNHTGKGAVQVYRCIQDRTRLCGRIVWLKQPVDDRGEPLRDGNNPKASMRTRPICGLPVLGNLKEASGGGWSGGWVYDPEKGKAYSAAIRARSAEQLTMTGYKGIFSKSYGWRRAPDDLPRCGELEPVTASAFGTR